MEFGISKIELERMFDNDESAKQRKPPLNVGNDDFDSFNLDSKEDPRMVKIGKVCTEKERKEIL